ncbi:hypothetical protein CAEBREN_30964 [Caenorhabditis brenneri]|uniref:Uncharacterized protein n=1 Tax=Caenorhabditis brenneri TaxID=135651 RepID=G0PFI9_CAEBE|nr:hypothetical protein CAEBREN_30964 [Caenorhabditis brenneri]
MVCDKLRWDKLGKLPSPLTQLHMNQTDWKVFEAGKLKELSNLRALKITNSKMTTKEMIDDIDDLYCDLNGHGTVWMLEALPGTNESVCLDPTEETKQWMTFVENAQKGIMERVYTSTVPPTESGEKDEKMMTMMTPKKTILETLDELEGGKTTGKITTK